jgi:hypothetical protein
MLAYLASEDSTTVTRERVDLAALAAARAAQSPASSTAAPARFRAPTTWPVCTKAPRITEPRLK